MKRLFSAIILGASLIFSGAFLSGCAEELVDINDEVTLGRCLTPTELSAKVINGEFIEFNWTKSKGATDFVLELYSDEEMTSLAETLTIPAGELPYTADLEADMTYYARVKGVNAEGAVEDSHWAVFDRALQTYAIKSSLNPELVDRSESSITIKWTADPEVDHVRITPAVSKEDGDYTRFDVNAAAVEAAQVEVTGLKPSVNYTLAVHFKSAERGTVAAWTRPSMEGATEVTTSEALIQAVADKAAVIKVAYSETPYVMGSVTLGGPVAIYGDATAQGEQPVIQGGFKIGADVTSVHLEALTFDGLQSDSYPHNLTFDAAATVESITVVNCTMNNYLRGVLYENSKAPKISKIKYDGVQVNGVVGDGGDCFDFRGAAVVNSVEFINSTLNGGARTWFRLDANTKLESIKLTHCTFNNLCFANNGNNNGIFNIRALNAAGAAPVFILTENVFLNMNDENKRCCLIAKNSTSAFPSEIGNNFFFNCYDRFFIPQSDGSKLSGDELTAAADEGRVRILVNGSVELAADPCVDSVRDKLNVTSAEVINANAGDPRWYEVYVEVPEDLTQEVTETGKVWNLTDGQVFKKMADKDMVRDGIRFYVKNTPVNFVEKGFEFSGQATVGEDGLPTDGAIGIKVNQPGHLYLSAVVSENGNESSPIVVNVDGKVSGSVAVGEEHKQICLSTLAEGEHMIYIYSAAGAVVLSELQWVDCTLETPEVTIDKTSVMAGTPEKVTLSWVHVANADSYEVTIGENKITVNENSYTFSAESLSLADGLYEIEVRAISAEATHVASVPAVVKLTVEVAEDPIVMVETLWDGAYFAETVAKYFPDYDNSAGITENFSNKKLRFIAGGGKFKYGENATLGTYIQLGGTGAAGTKACIQFTAGGPGKVTVKALSSGDGGRPLTIALGEEVVTAVEVSDKSQTELDVITADVNSVSGDLINIYSGKSGINVYEIKWEPKSAGSGIPSDPTAIEETYFMELIADNGFASQSIASGDGPMTIGKLTFGDNADFDGKRYKHKGASKLGDDGIPTNRFVSFKITAPGTISHKVISASSNATDRAYAVILVTNAGGTKQVTKLYEEYSPTSSSSDPVTTEVTADMLAGVTETATVYIYTLANCNTYAVGYDPAASAPAPVDLVWDFSAPEWVNAMTNSGIDKNTNSSDWNLEVNGLKVISGGSSIKWNVSGETYFWQPGGKSDGSNRYFEFTADVAGKLSVYASNTGSSEDLARMVTVKVGEGEPVSQPGGYSSSDGPHQLDFNIDAGTVKIYPTGNALRFYKIEFHSN